MTPEEIELLSELTIIIPTCNRPFELERAIEYWRVLPVTVFIIDGSERPWFSIGVLPTLSKIYYHHLPQNHGESSMENYCRRMEFASRLPTTKFSALCADDDFFTIRGMIHFCQRLKVDKSVDALVGICAEYTILEQKEFLWNLRYTEWKASSNSGSDNLRDRVLDTSSIFYLYYAIMRSECWRATVFNAFKISYNHHYFHEHAMTLICRAYGKSSCENRIYWVKKYFEPNPSVSPQLIREADWFRNPENDIEIKNFRYHLSGVIAQALGKSEHDNEAKDIVNSYLKRVSRFSDTAKFRKVKKLVLSNVTRFSRPIPLRCRQCINRILPRKIQVWTGASNERPLSHLIKNNKQKLSKLTEAIGNTEIKFEVDDLLLIEQVLSAPREELRLRANI